MSTMSLVATALVASTLGGCVLRLPPPPQPTRRAPSIAVPADETAPGAGRVVIEATDGAATAELITGRSASVAVVGGSVGTGSAIATRRLCTTPCAVDLARGEHEVILTMPGTNRVGKIVVVSAEQPQLVIASLGRQEHRIGRSLGGFMLGLVAIPTFVTTGIVYGVADDERSDGLLAAVAISGVLSALSVWLVASGRPTLQEPSYATFPIER